MIDMSLATVIRLFADAIVEIDPEETLPRETNRRTGATYLPGVAALTEGRFVDCFVLWARKVPALRESGIESIDSEVPYPDADNAKCDVVMAAADGDCQSLEVAIEVKRIQLIGDNGKANEYGVGKLVSPYLKDRSLLHDAKRLSQSKIARHKFVVGYGFEYDFATCDASQALHPDHTARVNEIREVCRRNDRDRGSLLLQPAVDVANYLLTKDDLVAEHMEVHFDGAWRHPCGGRGRVFGWRLKSN